MRRSPPKSSPAAALPRVKCPTCRKTGDWLSGGYWPFCSHRCKLIDLGKWLGGEHAISEPLKPEHLEQYGGSDPDKSQPGAKN